MKMRYILLAMTLMIINILILTFALMSRFPNILNVSSLETCLIFMWRFASSAIPATLIVYIPAIIIKKFAKQEIDGK